MIRKNTYHLIFRELNLAEVDTGSLSYRGNPLIMDIYNNFTTSMSAFQNQTQVTTKKILFKNTTTPRIQVEIHSLESEEFSLVPRLVSLIFLTYTYMCVTENLGIGP